MDHDKAKRRPFHVAFDLAQLQEFGALIYPGEESALLELVARSYEAGATSVDIRVTQRGTDKRAVILESDVGMSDEQLESLGNVGSPLAGAPNRERIWDTSKTRHYGNLACFAIGKRVEITTSQKGSGTASRVTTDLGKLESPETHHRAVCTSDITRSECGKRECRTRIKITKILQEADLGPDTLDRLAAHLVQRLVFADPKFAVKMSFNNVHRATVSNSSWRDVVTESSQWEFPDQKLLRGPHWRKVKGRVDVSGVIMPRSPTGIRLLVGKHEVNAPEFFGADVPVTFTSRTSGALHVDFVTDHRGTLKSGKPPMIDWAHPEMKKLRGDLRAAVLNLHLLWAKGRAGVTSSLIREKIDAEWFREMSPAQQGDLLGLLTSLEHGERGRAVDHALRTISNLMSPHPRRDRRAFHKDIISNKKVMELCDKQDYYQAVSECIKIYCEKVGKISQSRRHRGERGLMQSVFGSTGGRRGRIVLSTADDNISKGLQEGHRLLSEGLICGVKNIAVSHASQTELEQRGLFTEDDCLDILSLLSYLFRCIEKRDYPPPQE